jgi:hypothetical protein
MTADEYLHSVISKYRVSTGPDSPAHQAGQRLYPIIKDWANKFLLGISISGSYAKGTGIKGSTDIDLFISLDPATPGTLKEIYDDLYSCLVQNGYSARRKNVSIGLTYLNLQIDLIPGRKQAEDTNNHTIFRNIAQAWTQTNVQTHINQIRQSGRLDEIRAMKIWRNLNRLYFPSFYLELTVLAALDHKNKDQPGINVWTVLEYLRDRFITSQVVDPANSNNIISDDLTGNEKATISSVARSSLMMSNWEQILW